MLKKKSSKALSLSSSSIPQSTTKEMRKLGRYQEEQEKTNQQQDDGSSLSPDFDDDDNNDEESISTMSAITFECSNYDDIEEEEEKARLDEEVDENKGPKTALSNRNQCTPPPPQLPHPPKTPVHNNNSKAKRLSQVHDKVLTIQKENEQLKVTNRHLMLQMSSNNGNNKQPHPNSTTNNKKVVDEETTKRLSVIYQKVQEVQNENDVLKQENSKLHTLVQLLQLNQDNANQASNITTSTTESIDVDFNNVSTDAIEPTYRTLNLNNVSTDAIAPTPHKLNLNNVSTDVIVPTPHTLNLNNVSTDAIAPTPNEEKERKMMTHIAELEDLTIHSHKAEYIETKKELDGQHELLEKRLFCKNCDVPVGNRASTPQTSASISTRKQSNKVRNDIENNVTTKKRRGLLSRKGRRQPQQEQQRQIESDSNTDELSKKITELESRLHDSKIVRGQDVEKIAELGTENIHQRRNIISLESKVVNLEKQLENSSIVIRDLRDTHIIEIQDLQIAYDDLKEETANLVNWLKDQLSVYQGRSRYADEIALAEQDNDLDSLTKSEREALQIEISEERKKWKHLINSPTDAMVDLTNFRGHCGSESDSRSIGASTITTRSPI